MGRLFVKGPEDLGSIAVRVIPKTLKMVLDTALFNTQQYKVHIEGKVEQSRERSSALPYSVVAIEKGAFVSPSTKIANLTYFPPWINWNIFHLRYIYGIFYHNEFWVKMGVSRNIDNPIGAFKLADLCQLIRCLLL